MGTIILKYVQTKFILPSSISISVHSLTGNKSYLKFGPKEYSEIYVSCIIVKYHNVDIYGNKTFSLGVFWFYSN